MTGIPHVAVIGRRNVGKSTLVNRLFGRRQAIAHESPGVTRDRVELEANWRGKRFGLVDTAGFAQHARGVESLAAKQAERAVEEADLIILVVDTQAGITEEDAQLTRRLRRVRAPVLVVANKADTERDEPGVSIFYALGLGEPLPVSALHGRACGELLDRVAALLPDALPEATAAPEPRFAIVGRPNVGKSSLFNRLVGHERSVVFEEAGTTRDSVDALVPWSDGPVRFIDTAGMRRPIKVQGIEYYSLLRATEAIDRADVAVLVIDATEGFTFEDKKIAARVMEAGRALIVAANKWDLVQEKDPRYKELREMVHLFAGASVVRTSALSGLGVYRLPRQLLTLHARWSFRAPTWRVNEIVQLAQAERPASRSAGRFHYATQVSAAPPSFVIFGGREPAAPYRRYLENRLRMAFDFGGVPIRLTFRSRRRDRAR